MKSAGGIRIRSANLIVARSSDCNKAGYRAATTRRCQNNGSLANGEAFIQLAWEAGGPTPARIRQGMADVEVLKALLAA